jgi:single-stranded DNA-binding protein
MNSKLVVTIGRLDKDPVMDCNKVAKLELVEVSGEHTQFTHCVATGKQAEVVMRDLKKGMLICIKGEWKEHTLEAFYIFKEI